MEQITLTNSFVQHFGKDTFALFIGHRDGRYGIVAAGNWETVLPFCFESIHVCPGNLIAADCNGENHLYHIDLDNNGVVAIPALPERKAMPRAICLPA